MKSLKSTAFVSLYIKDNFTFAAPNLKTNPLFCSTKRAKKVKIKLKSPEKKTIQKAL